MIQMQFPEHPIEFLTMSSEEQFVNSRGKVVDSATLQKAVTLFVHYVTTPKIEGMWNKKMYDAILTKSHGNCVWTSVKNTRSSDMAERPLSPERIVSGVNMYSENYQLSKLLQFHFLPSEGFHADGHNKINLEKLGKLLVSKQNSLDDRETTNK